MWHVEQRLLADHVLHGFISTDDGATDGFDDCFVCICQHRVVDLNWNCLRPIRHELKQQREECDLASCFQALGGRSSAIAADAFDSLRLLGCTASFLSTDARLRRVQPFQTCRKLRHLIL